eukprot:541999-Pyramimonas_sp.AAC.1
MEVGHWSVVTGVSYPGRLSRGLGDWSPSCRQHEGDWRVSDRPCHPGQVYRRECSHVAAVGDRRWRAD